MKTKPTVADHAAKGKIRLRTLIEQAYTPEQWLHRFRRLTVQDQYRLWAQVEPKEMKVDQSSTFRLVIEGLQNKVIESQAIESVALAAHEEEDP